TAADGGGFVVAEVAQAVQPFHDLIAREARLDPEVAPADSHHAHGTDPVQTSERYAPGEVDREGVLAGPLPTDRHPSRRVQQQLTGQTFRRFSFLDADLAGARGDAPVDGADRVAPLVGPRLHELDARPQEGRAVRAVTQAVREPLDGNQELSCVQRIAGLQV